MKIAILDAFTTCPAADAAWQAFKDLGEVTVHDRTAPADVPARIAGADMVLTNKVVLDAAAIEGSPALRYIGVLATGYNVVDIEAARRRGIVVSNVPAYSTASVAQTAISLLLALTNRAESYGQLNAAGRWSRSSDFTYSIGPWHELAGKTFGVVGLGHTGAATAAIAHAMGMKIAVATSKSQEQLPEGYVKTALDELFRTADVVSLHCPLTADTAGMVNAARLRSMKPGALLINTSRGPVVDENALAEALNQGVIAGAGLDVMCREPPAADNPLLHARNCIVTPHTAWASVEARGRLLASALESARAFAAGHPVNVVS